jgi:hypothetical protein
LRRSKTALRRALQCLLEAVMRIPCILTGTWAAGLGLENTAWQAKDRGKAR